MRIAETMIFKCKYCNGPLANLPHEGLTANFVCKRCKVYFIVDYTKQPRKLVVKK